MSVYSGYEIYQIGSEEFEVIGIYSDDQSGALEPLMEGTLTQCQQEYPNCEVFTCASLGEDPCTILAGEEQCRICES